MKKVKIADYLHLENIRFLKASSREEAIEKLVLNLNLPKPLDKQAFLQAVIDRENIVSTGVGMGVAIPHAKLENIQDFFISVGVQKTEGLNWDAIDKSQVRLIFLIGGPCKRRDEYLQILSHLTAIIKDENIRRKIVKSDSEKDIFQLLMQY